MSGARVSAQRRAEARGHKPEAGRFSNARHHFPGVHRVQTAQLQHDQEQEEDDRAAGAEQVLPVLPEALSSPRDEVELRADGCELSAELGQ